MKVRSKLSNLSLESLSLTADYLLIGILEQESSQGFMLPDKHREKPNIGKVIKVGNGKTSEKNLEIFISQGDTIIFNEWSAKEIEGLSNNEYNRLFYIKQSDVIAFVKGGQSV